MYRLCCLSVLALSFTLAAWLAYVRWRVGPADQGWSNFTLPGAGFVEEKGGVY